MAHSPPFGEHLQVTTSRAIARDVVAGDDVTPGIPTKVCAHCGDAISGRWQRRFCSDRCRSAAARRRRAELPENHPDRTGRPMIGWRRRQRDVW